MKKIKHIKFTDEELQEIKKGDEDEKWLNSLSPGKLREYASEYIAVKGKRIVTHSKSIRKLHEKLDDLNLSFVTIRRIEGPVLVVY